MSERLNLALTLGFFGAMFWLAWRNRKWRRRVRAVPDDPNQPYRVFTDQFDIELRGIELREKLIGASPDNQRGWFVISLESWRREIAAATAIYDAEQPLFAETFDSSGPSLRDVAVTILIDQSGSMRGEPMRYTAAAARLLTEMLQARDAKTEVLGFSTAGWHGGFARRKWIAERRPKRPGRVCALLHIVYHSFAESTFASESWEAMLDPNVLRENIDGEAIQWATRRLRGIARERKHLLIISDGAPMDDATAASNGLGYLTRHLQQVLGELRAAGDICLGSIEIGHEGLYPPESAIFAADATEIPRAMFQWGRELAKSVTVE